MWTDTAAKYQGPECAAAHSEWAKSLWIPPEHYSVGSESSPVLSCTQTQATAVRQVSLERGQFNPFKAFLSAELAGCTSSGNSSFFFFEKHWTKYNYWGTVALQYCVGLCHTSTWISHRYTHASSIEPPFHLPPHPTARGCHKTLGLSSLCHTANEVDEPRVYCTEWNKSERDKYNTWF